MKRYFYVLLGLLAAAFGKGCKEEENQGIAPQLVQNVKAIPDFGAVKFVWDKLDSTSVLYASINYTDANSKAVVEKFSIYADTAYIGSLKAEEYEFQIILVGHSGAASAPTTIKVTPLAPAYELVAATIKAEPLFGGVKFVWENESAKAIAVNIRYKITNEEQFSVTSSALLKDSVVIAGLSANPIDFTVSVQDETGNVSEAKIIPLTPYEEIRLDKSAWAVSASSEENEGEGPDNGWAKHAIDDNLNSFWHTAWLNSSPSYPHWLAVDLAKAVVVSRIELINRQNNASGFTKFSLQGSTDGENWEEYGTFTFLQQNAVQSFLVPATPTVRYLRLTLLEGLSSYAFLAEFSVFGQEVE